MANGNNNDNEVRRRDSEGDLLSSTERARLRQGLPVEDVPQNQETQEQEEDEEEDQSSQTDTTSADTDTDNEVRRRDDEGNLLSSTERARLRAGEPVEDVSESQPDQKEEDKQDTYDEEDDSQGLNIPSIEIPDNNDVETSDISREKAQELLKEERELIQEPGFSQEDLERQQEIRDQLEGTGFDETAPGEILPPVNTDIVAGVTVEDQEQGVADAIQQEADIRAVKENTENQIDFLQNNPDIQTVEVGGERISRDKAIDRLQDTRESAAEAEQTISEAIEERRNLFEERERERDQREFTAANQLQEELIRQRASTRPDVETVQETGFLDRPGESLLEGSIEGFQAQAEATEMLGPAPEIISQAGEPLPIQRGPQTLEATISTTQNIEDQLNLDITPDVEVPTPAETEQEEEFEESVVTGGFQSGTSLPLFGTATVGATATSLRPDTPGFFEGAAAGIPITAQSISNQGPTSFVGEETGEEIGEALLLSPIAGATSTVIPEPEFIVEGRARIPDTPIQRTGRRIDEAFSTASRFVTGDLGVRPGEANIVQVPESQLTESQQLEQVRQAQEFGLIRREEDVTITDEGGIIRDVEIATPEGVITGRRTEEPVTRTEFARERLPSTEDIELPDVSFDLTNRRAGQFAPSRQTQEPSGVEPDTPDTDIEFGEEVEPSDIFSDTVRDLGVDNRRGIDLGVRPSIETGLDLDEGQTPFEDQDKTPFERQPQIREEEFIFEQEITPDQRIELISEPRLERTREPELVSDPRVEQVPENERTPGIDLDLALGSVSDQARETDVQGRGTRRLPSIDAVLLGIEQEEEEPDEFTGFETRGLL